MKMCDVYLHNMFVKLRDHSTKGNIVEFYVSECFMFIHIGASLLLLLYEMLSIIIKKVLQCFWVTMMNSRKCLFLEEIKEYYCDVVNFFTELLDQISVLFPKWENLFVFYSFSLHTKRGFF